jgi:hypothetical protein
MAYDAFFQQFNPFRANAAENLGQFVMQYVKDNRNAQAVIGLTRGTVGFEYGGRAAADVPTEFKFRRGQLESAKLLLNRIAREAAAGFILSPADLHELQSMLDHSP